MWDEYKHKTTKRKVDRDDDDAVLGERLLVDEDSNHGHAKPAQEKLNFKETAVLSLEFCVLWFVANYFASACLEYTSVASVTILTSTSSAWTLIIGSMFGVELFTVRKLMGVMASLIGVILISMVDLSGKSDEDRGSFPYKSPGEIAIGDAMALISAVIYSIYVTVMKRRVGDEEKVNMQLFFGLVGFFNLLFLWPVFFILHWTGLETVSQVIDLVLHSLLTKELVRAATKRSGLGHYYRGFTIITLLYIRTDMCFIREIRWHPTLAIYHGHMPCCSLHHSSSLWDSL